MTFLMVWHRLEDCMLMEVHRLDIMLVIVIMVKLVVRLMVYTTELINVMMLPVFVFHWFRLWNSLLLSRLWLCFGCS